MLTSFWFGHVTSHHPLTWSPDFVMHFRFSGEEQPKPTFPWKGSLLVSHSTFSLFITQKFMQGQQTSKGLCKVESFHLRRIIILKYPIQFEATVNNGKPTRRNNAVFSKSVLFVLLAEKPNYHFNFPLTYQLYQQYIWIQDKERPHLSNVLLYRRVTFWSSRIKRYFLKRASWRLSGISFRSWAPVK